MSGEQNENAVTPQEYRRPVLRVLDAGAAAGKPNVSPTEETVAGFDFGS